MPCGLSAAAGECEITYYPRMPGNSTAYAEEKRAAQAGAQSPSFFKGAERVRCPMRPLAQLVRGHGIGRIDLLKVLAVVSYSLAHV